MTTTELTILDFEGDQITAAARDGKVYVAVRPIVENLGLSWGSQYNRLRRDPVLAEGVFVMKTPDARGTSQEMLFLELQLLHGWLFRIDASRVRPDLRERVLMYQRHCYRILFEHFSGKAGAKEAAAPLESRRRHLLARPLPPMLTRSRANRIRHWRAIHDEAITMLAYLGDESGGQWREPLFVDYDANDGAGNHASGSYEACE